MEITNLLETEVLLEHKFQKLVLNLEEEKSTSIETLVKKYRDSLGIGTNLESLVITANTQATPIQLSGDVVGGTHYIIEIAHDSKGNAS